MVTVTIALLLFISTFAVAMEQGLAEAQHIRQAARTNRGHHNGWTLPQPTATPLPAPTPPPALTLEPTITPSPRPSPTSTPTSAPTSTPTPTPTYSVFKLGIYSSSWNFHEYTTQNIASSFDMSQSYWIQPSDLYNQYDTKMNQVLAQNPNYKFLVYRNGISVPDYWVDQWNYAKSQGWLLKDINGNYVSEGSWSNLYGADITNPSYQRWFASEVSSWLVQHPSFAGVFIDNSMKYNADIFNYCFNSRPIDPSTGAYFTDSDVRNGMAGLINAVIDAVGPSKLVMPNGINRGVVWWNNPSADGYRAILSQVPRLNCIASEGTFRAYNDQWFSESDWKASVDFVSWVQNNFLTLGSDRHFSAGCQAQTLPAGASVNQVMLYGFSSMLLAVDYSSPRNTIDFMLDYSTNSAALQFAQKLRNIDLMAPLGNYYQVGSTSVHSRDFVNGKVLVNPSSSAYTVSVTGTFINFSDNSTVTSSISVPAHTGIILLKK